MSGTMSDEEKKDMDQRGEKLWDTLFGAKKPPITYQEALNRGYLDVEPYNGEEPKKPWSKWEDEILSTGTNKRTKEVICPDCGGIKPSCNCSI